MPRRDEWRKCEGALGSHADRRIAVEKLTAVGANLEYIELPEAGHLLDGAPWSEVMDWIPGSHASTFGGNPISCRAALATIELLEEGLVENAARVGSYILEKLREFQRRFHLIGDVRERA
jgi:glutamate-1-semialdehyde aminotransferase